MNTILRFVFEKLPVFNWINGKKTAIGRAVTVLSGSAAILQQQFPELPYVSSVNAWIALAAGLVIKEIGEAHSAAKKISY